VHKLDTIRWVGVFSPHAFQNALWNSQTVGADDIASLTDASMGVGDALLWPLSSQKLIKSPWRQKHSVFWVTAASGRIKSLASTD